MKTFFAFLTVLLLLASSAMAVTKASGTFRATATCELFQSKTRRTNPGRLQSQVGQRYAIREAILAQDRPEWFKVETASTVGSKQRWIEASCGDTENLNLNVSAVPGPSSSPGGASACRRPQAYDSHVLAISWQPAFCELRNKAECQSLDGARYDASHFTLHGLWPNKTSCDRSYGFCGNVRSTPGDFCAYPAVALAEPVRARLSVVMPSAKFGTCLQRHEWWKHGTCRNQDPNLYYELAMDLLASINRSSFVADFMRNHIGQTVSRDAVHAAFDAAFGAHAHTHISLSCRNGMLTEIQLALPKDLSSCTSLQTLLTQGQTLQGGRCGARFKIDAAGPS